MTSRLDNIENAAKRGTQGNLILAERYADNGEYSHCAIIDIDNDGNEIAMVLDGPDAEHIATSSPAKILKLVELCRTMQHALEYSKPYVARIRDTYVIDNALTLFREFDGAGA